MFVVEFCLDGSSNRLVSFEGVHEYVQWEPNLQNSTYCTYEIWFYGFIRNSRQCAVGVMGHVGCNTAVSSRRKTFALSPRVDTRRFLRIATKLSLSKLDFFE
jgi:hypothetical protein